MSQHRKYLCVPLTELHQGQRRKVYMHAHTTQ